MSAETSFFLDYSNWWLVIVAIFIIVSFLVVLTIMVAFVMAQQHDILQAVAPVV